jgi:AcrR family transcriptional regulator
MGITERKAREKTLRRKQISDAARKVFADKGFKGATVEDIAREAELSPGTLYLYFNSKDEIYFSLNISILKFLNGELEKLGKRRGLTPTQKIEALTQVFLDLYELDPFTLKFLFQLQASGDIGNLSPQLLTEIKDLSVLSLNLLVSIFEQGLEQGHFSDVHPVALADIVWGLFTGLVIWEESKKVFGAPKDHLKDTLGLALDIIIRGIKRNEALSGQPD